MKKFFSNSTERLYQSSLDAIQNSCGEQDLAALAIPLSDSGLSGELEAARWLHSRQKSLDPRPGFLTASRKRVIAAVQAEGSRRPVLRLAINFMNARPVHQFVLAVLILAAFLTGHITVLAADTSIPGDMVYPIKLVLERVQLAASIDQDQDAQLHILFSQRRLSELQATVLEGRYECIPGVAGAFQAQINQTLASLDRLDGADQQKVYLLIAGFNNSLNIQARTLAAFTTMIPSEERGEVVAAIDAYSVGTLKMQDMIDN